MYNSRGSQFFISKSRASPMLDFTPVAEATDWAMIASGISSLGAAATHRRH
jgi:hypothetical protein